MDAQRVSQNYPRTKKKRRVTYEDSYKGYNVIINYCIYFLNKISSLWNHSLRFQSISNLTDFLYSRPSNKIYVAYFYIPGVSFSS